MKAIVLVTVIALAGCLGTPAATTHTPNGTQSATSIASGDGISGTGPGLPSWLVGQTIEGIGCRGLTVDLYADRQAVQAAMPPRFKVPGSGPVDLFVTLDSCNSASIGNQTVIEKPTFLIAYVLFKNTTQDGEDPAYLLEFSSSWDLPIAALQGTGVPGAKIESTRTPGPTGEDYRITGTGTQYTLSVLPNASDQTKIPDFRALYFAGTNGKVQLFHDVSIGQGDRIPTTCNFDLSKGALAALKPSPPCLAGHMDEGWTLKFQAK